MQRSKRPVRKVAAAGTSGVVATLALVVADALGWDVSPGVAAAITTLIAAGTGYGTPPAPDEPRAGV